MGFATACTKTTTRARDMQQTCHEVLGELGIKDDPRLMLPWSWKKSRLMMNISSRRSSIRILILFRHHPESHGLSDNHIYGFVCAGRRLGGAVE